MEWAGNKSRHNNYNQSTEINLSSRASNLLISSSILKHLLWQVGPLTLRQYSQDVSISKPVAWEKQKSA